MFLAGEAFYARLNPEFWDPPLPPMSEAEPKTGVLPPAKMPRLPSEEGPMDLCPPKSMGAHVFGGRGILCPPKSRVLGSTPPPYV
jgi:hypothetical protein